jgi:hypothetical protein
LHLKYSDGHCTLVVTLSPTVELIIWTENIQLRSSVPETTKPSQRHIQIHSLHDDHPTWVVLVTGINNDSAFQEYSPSTPSVNPTRY